MPAMRGMQPKKCQYCERKFSKVDHLKRHERSHTGERPYSCPQCHKKFSRSDVLIRHQKCHPRPGTSHSTEKRSHSPSSDFNSNPTPNFSSGRKPNRRRTLTNTSSQTTPTQPQQIQQAQAPIPFASLIDPALQDQFTSRTPSYTSPYSSTSVVKKEDGNEMIDPSLGLGFGRGWDRGMSSSPFVTRDDHEGEREMFGQEGRARFEGGEVGASIGRLG